MSSLYLQEGCQEHSESSYSFTGGRARQGFMISEHVILLVLLCFLCGECASLIIETGPASGGWTIYPPLSALPQAISGSGVRNDLVACEHGVVHRFSIAGWYQLCGNCTQPPDKRNEHDAPSFNDLGFHHYGYSRNTFFPCIVCSSILLLFDLSFGTSFYLSDIFLMAHRCITPAEARFSFQTPVLVPRSPGIIHRTVACIGIGIGHYFHTGTQADLRVQSHDWFHACNRLSVVRRFGDIICSSRA